MIGAFLWGTTLFLGARLASTRTFSTFVERSGGWVADAVCALVGDRDIAVTGASHGLRVAGARWQRYAWLPVPEARALKHAVRYAKRQGFDPAISVATFLVDVCRFSPADVAGSLIWPTSRVGFRTGRKRRSTHTVNRIWYGTGPQRWNLDLGSIIAGRSSRTALWEAGLLARIVGVIFLGLELGDLLVGGAP